MFRDAKSPDPVFTDTLTLDLGDVVPSLAGPKRPQDRVALPRGVNRSSPPRWSANTRSARDEQKRYAVEGERLRSRPRRRRDRRDHLVHQHLEPLVLIGAGLLARKAVPRA
jgi:aconitate hydratase